MRQRQPSNAVHGCGNLVCARGVDPVSIKGNPKACSRAGSSPLCSFTSAKITPLQHSPQARQSCSAIESVLAVESFTGILLQLISTLSHYQLSTHITINFCRHLYQYTPQAWLYS